MDLNKLESKLDDALSKETTESLTNWLNNKRMKTYRKTATVQAKLFEEGDEDGFVHPGGYFGMMEDAHYGIKEPRLLPFIKTLENPWHTGEFGKHYLCVGIKGERWLVEKEIFESTYEEVTTKTE